MAEMGSLGVGESLRYTGMGIGGRCVQALRSVRPGKPKA